MKNWTRHRWVIHGFAFAAILAMIIGQEKEAVSGPAPDWRLVLELMNAREGWAKVNPGGCAKPFEIKDIDCASEIGKPTEMKCRDCKTATNRLQRPNGPLEKSKTAGQRCENTGDCGLGGKKYDPKAQLDAMTRAGTLTEEASTCLGSKIAFNAEMSGAAQECKTALKDCSGIGKTPQKVADENKQACEDAKKDADDTKKDQGDKKKEVDKQGDKNKDNAKKEGSGGGMPPIPQMPQQKEEPKQDPVASDPTVTSQPQVATETKPETESSKIGEPNKIGTPTVGFGGSSTETSVSTLATPGFGGGSSPAFHEDPKRSFGDNSLGGPLPNQNAGGVGGGGGGGGGAGGGSLNTTGASVPGEGKAASEGSNPYEINAGGGGKLGAPKGLKSGGESDSAIDGAAKDTFKNDLGMDNPTDVAGGENGAPVDDPSAGFTIFKMVKYRYSELKKRGNI